MLSTFSYSTESIQEIFQDGFKIYFYSLYMTLGQFSLRVNKSLLNKSELFFIIFVIAFMQGIYNYIPQINSISMVYSVAAVVYLQFVLHVMLFGIVNMFCIFTLVLSAVCVCSAQYGCFLYSYFLNFAFSLYNAQVLSE